MLLIIFSSFARVEHGIAISRDNLERDEHTQQSQGGV